LAAALVAVRVSKGVRVIIRKLTALLFVVFLAAAACSGSGSDEPTQTPPAGLTPTAPAAPTATATTPPASTATPESARAVQAARSELGRWLGPVGDPPSITVESVERVTWRNGCLEVHRAGRACTQALVEGFRIQLRLANATYEVRSDLTGSTLVWVPQVEILVRFVEASPNLLSFRTDDGGEIVAQAVPGSDIAVNVRSIAPGTPVGLALADAPQSGGFLLVWVDPVP
jgi:hypothetical protein